MRNEKNITAVTLTSAIFCMDELTHSMNKGKITNFINLFPDKL